MKKFYDREREMGMLRDAQQQAFNDYSRWVIVTGRRRVGKTSLVYRFMQESAAGNPGLYFFVGRKTEAMLTASFADEASTKLGEYIPEGIRTFRELFRLLLEMGKRRRFTLFIDEFQEFDNVNPEIFSDMQELWDRYKKQTNVCLITSGSIFRLIEKIFKDERQPLFGRDDCTIRLQPFSTATLREILADHQPGYTSDDLLALWTVTGGVARYVELLMNNRCTSVGEMIHYICDSGDSFFLNEGTNVLIQEFGKQYGTYFSILGQIAGGDVTQGQIEGALGMASLGGQLKMLEEKYEIVSRKRPVGAKPNSQTVRYEIRDNFFRFWFRYFHRYTQLIELGNMPALEKIMLDDYPTFSGLSLERWFRRKMQETFRYKEIGGWWQSRDGKQKIDIVAVTLEGEVEAYEVKRNKDRYRPALLAGKVAVMQQKLFRGKAVNLSCLSLDDM